MTAATAHAWNTADAWTALQRAETTPHELAAIAAAHPDYATQIAAHPQAYPALVEWAEQVAAQRSAPDASPAADVTDLVGGTRRASGAHPLAFSADADAWRAAVAAGAALTEGAPPHAGAPRAGDLPTDRVAWTPAADLPVAGVEKARDAAPTAIAPASPEAEPAQPGAEAGEPWWAGVSPAAPDATPRAASDASHPAHRATFEPLAAPRAEALAVGTAAGAAGVSPAPPECPAQSARPALPRQSAAAAARAAGAAYAAAVAPPASPVVASAAPASAAPASLSPELAPSAPAAAVVDARALLAFVFAFVVAPLGIVFGHLALRDIAATGAPGRGYAVAGLVVGYAVIATALVAAAVTVFTLLAR